MLISGIVQAGPIKEGIMNKYQRHISALRQAHQKETLGTKIINALLMALMVAVMYVGTVILFSLGGTP